MAATWTTNVTLSPKNEYSAFIDCCNTIGAYIIIVKSEIPDGSYAIFHIASASDGQKKVKKTVSVAGSNGEQLHIVWPEDMSPVICYDADEHAPEEERHYNLKIL
jgi:hypothetical protein